MESWGLVLDAILVTHHHRDHIGGIDDLQHHYGNQLPVYGPFSQRIPSINIPLKAGDGIDLAGMHFDVIPTPGDALQPPSLFCGDALFAGGCGRRFEGTAEDMWASLERLAALPEETLVYCAHEYTLDNLRFAVAIEPDNRELQQRLLTVEAQRAQGQITLPSFIGLEKRTNPFLRCHLRSIRDVVENHFADTFETPAKVFGALRLMKDTWR
ncbi:hydroxyacylglutathione hydrolase [Cellvibrio japonicus]|uniref:Hydroxyacylglutathione hydrolase n=1 Tax=Cellvibrio japonicus (strain Ueda107) TaxID=498211 RepID=B3PHQ1_CELJU|nr:hydroxyacylglutathione hydrolase [Cellvibrio japonicus]ACE86360.1 hydroxyacylglutathione hydrolase [Cellvibrio japonicus Ueda107]